MNRLIPHRIIVLACILMLPLAAFAQLPSPTYGWNLGNTLEPPSGEGTWGPAATQNLINAVANAGFNTVRLPVAWDSHANQSTYVIDSAWMARVKQVVDWCVARNLYVIINCHWDNGWLENNITDSVNPTINAKMQSYWTQIANTFKNYDSRLIFAGANEPAVDTAAEMTTLNAYYQTFINAVRATGGNNSTRWLAIQGPSTDIDYTDSLMNTLPTDSASGRLMIEVHYYSPYQFTLMTADADWGKMFYFWGQAYHHATRTDRNANWGEEAYVNSQFEKMRAKFIARGIPVIIGEFQGFKRAVSSDLTGTDYNLHVASRTFFHKTIVDTANSKGLKPIYWDIAGQMFDWTTGATTDADNLRTLVGGAALPPPGTSNLTVSATSLSLGASAGSTTFSITSNVSWTTSDDQSWLTVTPASGSNNATATVTATANTATTSRTGTVTVTGSGITRTITVTQSGVTSSNLTVSTTSLSFGAAAGSASFSITSNVSWTTTDNQSWITVTPASGSNNATATVTVTANTATASRSGTVTVTGGSITRTITVTQAGTTGTTADTYQAESGTIAGGVTIDSNNTGFNGTGFANFPANGGSLTFSNVDGNGGGTKALQIRYALGITSSRTGTITVNGTATNITFAPTGSWTTWNTLTVNITLNNNSTNTIRFASTGSDLGNIDQIIVP
ncbi:MAG: cellulase family glycosylhydrolase [Nibricoccus sp.]